MTGGSTPIWVNELPEISGTVEVVLLGDRLVASRSGGDLVAIRLMDGSLIPGSFAHPDSTQWSPNGLMAMDTDSEGLTALFDQRLVRFDLSGAIVGIDAIGEERTFISLLPTLRYDLVVDEQPRDPTDGSYRYWIHRFERDGGCRLAARSLELTLRDRRINHVEVVDGWLLLSTGTTILAVPMPPESGVVPPPADDGA
jgi:hypothetical protein